MGATEGTKQLQPEKCFWLLVALMNLLPDYHSAQMKCLNSDITVVDNILNKVRHIHNKVLKELLIRLDDSHFLQSEQNVILVLQGIVNLLCLKN